MNISTPKTSLSLLQTLLPSRAGHMAGLVVCAAFTFRGIALAAVEVRPQRIEETRALIFDDDKVSRTPAALKLVLVLEGPEAEAATQYGHVRIEEAADSTGGNLIPQPDTFHDPSKFRDYSNAFFRNAKFGGNPEKAKPQIDFDLALPARAAARIVRLRGSLELSDAGKTNLVQFAGVKGAGKKTVPLPNGSPVSVTIVIPDGEQVRSLGLETTGDDSALASIEVVDAGGKKVSTGISKWSLNGGPAEQSLGLSRPLDDSMKLLIKIISARKLTKIPFDLRDIPLP